MHNLKQPNSFEDVLKHVGPLGRWQLIIYAIVAYLEFWTTFYNLAVVFFQLVPDHFCPIPALSNSGWSNEQIVNIRLNTLLTTYLCT